MGYTFEDLQVLIKDMVKKLPLTVDAMNNMKNTQLEEQKILDLAQELLDIRVDGTQNTYPVEAIEEVAFAQRKEDTNDDLWTVFNRIQENIIEGNFEYKTPSGKLRQARIIKNFKQDMDVNKKMFIKAIEYAA